ncbi:hypothetical protein BV25DRAFT_1920784 [Artomyces pyxidatus]|uniref:Uncharacterized protein n=1 Tax=Artomyces pyxidatus TaxID=48021 RepID=A0ACB8SJS3_9AGAM|nr:hypothetical protein BV25DRAFT_1920784 [Artomyces pyxidatus]
MLHLSLDIPRHPTRVSISLQGFLLSHFHLRPEGDFSSHHQPERAAQRFMLHAGGHSDTFSVQLLTLRNFAQLTQETLCPLGPYRLQHDICDDKKILFARPLVRREPAAAGAPPTFRRIPSLRMGEQITGGEVRDVTFQEIAAGDFVEVVAFLDITSDKYDNGLPRIRLRLIPSHLTILSRAHISDLATGRAFEKFHPPSPLLPPTP